MFTSRINAIDETTAELADHYGVSKSTISRWKRGEGQPRDVNTRRSVIRRGKTHLAIRKGEAIEGRIGIWIDNRIAELQDKVDLAKGAEKKSYQDDIDALNKIKQGDLADLIEAAKHNRTDKDWDEWRGDYETISGTITSV